MNVSPIRTLPRRKISRRTTIRHRTILPGAETIARARTLAAAATIAAGTGGQTADAAAAGAAVEEEDARGEDARKAARVAGAISRPQNTLRRRAANPAVTTTAEASHADTTTGVRILRAARARLRRQIQPKSRFFFPANRSRSIAAGPQPLLHRHRWSSMMFMNRSPKWKRALRECLAAQRRPLQAAAFPAGFPGAFPAGSWPLPAPKRKR